jgi:hypothetical protein
MTEPTNNLPHDTPAESLPFGALLILEPIEVVNSGESENIISSQFISTAVLPAAEEFTRIGKIR